MWNSSNIQHNQNINVYLLFSPTSKRIINISFNGRCNLSSGPVPEVRVPLRTVTEEVPVVGQQLLPRPHRLAGQQAGQAAVARVEVDGELTVGRERVVTLVAQGSAVLLWGKPSNSVP